MQRVEYKVQSTKDLMKIINSEVKTVNLQTLNKSKQLLKYTKKKKKKKKKKNNVFFF